MTTSKISSFSEFYPFYLSEHSNRMCRRLHFIGSSGVILCLVMFFVTMNGWWLLGTLFAGYGAAWIGHFVFEKNRPATFTYPLWSLACDWLMYRDMLRGRVTF
jgi:hypothetical protein